MKTISYLTTLLFAATFSSLSFSQSNLQILDCESAVLKQYQLEKKSCYTPNIPRVGNETVLFADCGTAASKRYIRNSCVPALATVINNYSIVWQQLRLINEQYEKKQVSYNTAAKQGVDLMTLLAKESDDYYDMMQMVLKGIRADEAAKESRRFLNLALGGLNIIAKSGSIETPNNMTYILNGKTYHCSTLGSITTCN